MQESWQSRGIIIVIAYKFELDGLTDSRDIALTNKLIGEYYIRL